MRWSGNVLKSAVHGAGLAWVHDSCCSLQLPNQAGTAGPALSSLPHLALTCCTSLALRQFVGTVTRTTDVRPELFTGTFRCMECMTGALCSREAQRGTLQTCCQQGAMQLRSCSGTGAAVGLSAAVAVGDRRSRGNLAMPAVFLPGAMPQGSSHRLLALWVCFLMSGYSGEGCGAAVQVHAAGHLPQPHLRQQVRGQGAGG